MCVSRAIISEYGCHSHLCSVVLAGPLLAPLRMRGTRPMTLSGGYACPTGDPRFSGFGYVAQVLQWETSTSLWDWALSGCQKPPRHGPFGGHVGMGKGIPLGLPRRTIHMPCVLPFE